MLKLKCDKLPKLSNDINISKKSIFNYKSYQVNLICVMKILLREFIKYLMI